MKNIRYLLAISIVPLLLTGCGNNPGDNSGEDIEVEPHVLKFDHDHNHIPTTSGDFVCYDDKGREVTGYCAIDYNLEILNADGPFVFTQKEYGHVATYKINFNLTNIGKLYFDYEPNLLVLMTYFLVSSDTSGGIIPDKTIIYEDKEHKSYGAALNFQLDGVSIVQDEFNGFEITYYPVD